MRRKTDTPHPSPTPRSHEVYSLTGEEKSQTHFLGALYALGAGLSTRNAMVKKAVRVPARMNFVEKMNVNQMITQINTPQ